MRSNRKSIKTLEKTQKEYTLYRKLNWKTYKSVHTFFRANVQKRTNPRTEQEMNVKYNDFNMSKKHCCPLKIAKRSLKWLKYS